MNDGESSADRLHRGLEMRARVLGEEHESTSARAPFAEVALEVAWAGIWSRPGSHCATGASSLSTLIVLDKPVELTEHVRGALRNGLTREEIIEACIHASLYCGMPAANATFRVIAPILDEMSE